MSQTLFKDFGVELTQILPRAIAAIPKHLSKDIWRRARRGLFLVVDPVASFKWHSRSDPNVILVVRVDKIGDFIVWLDSARILREFYTNKKVVLLANRSVVELARRSGYFDEVVGVDVSLFDRDLSYRFRTLRKIRDLNARVAIQPTFSRTFWIGDSMIRATGAEERIGSVGDLSNIEPWQRWISNRWYTRLVSGGSNGLSEFEHNSEFLRGLGLQFSTPAVTRLQTLSDLPPPLRIKSEYFIIFPGAGSVKRMWPPEWFGTVARAIAEEHGWRLVVCGSKGEMNLAQAVVEYSKLEGSHQLAGKTSLPQLVELVRGARLLIANETSAVHIAAAVGTPSICVLGGGHFGRFVPYPNSVKGTHPIAVYHRMECFGCNWRCTLPHTPGGPVPCISAINIQDVLSLARQCILSRVVGVAEAG